MGYIGSCNALNDTSGRICVSNKPEDINLSFFILITGIIESKLYQNIYHANINVNSIVQNVIQMKSAISINAGVSMKTQKYIMCTKSCHLWTWQIFRKYYWRLSNCVWWNDRSEKNRSNNSCSNKKYLNRFLYFTHLFINYHSIMDSC